MSLSYHPVVLSWPLAKYTLYVQEDFEPAADFALRFTDAVNIMQEKPGLDMIRFYAYFKYPYLKPYRNGFSEMQFKWWLPGYKKFYYYSDHPHLRKSNFFEKFGRYPEGEIVRSFSRPALHRPMFIDAPAFGNFLLFARFNHGRSDHPVLDDGSLVPEAWLQDIKATSDRLSVAIGWQPGDLLMLDNTRFMHGRTAILDPGERVIQTYFGYLRFAIPDPEEPVDAIWRRENFVPPAPPDHP